MYIDSVLGSPTSGSSNSPIDISYESECQNGDDIPKFVRQCIEFIERVRGIVVNRGQNNI